MTDFTADRALVFDTVPDLADDFTTRWDNALPAADFAALDAFGFFSVLDAALAAPFEVTFLGDLAWDKALPAALLDALVAVFDRMVLDALLAAFGFVTLDVRFTATFITPFSMMLNSLIVPRRIYVKMISTKTKAKH